MNQFFIIVGAFLMITACTSSGYEESKRIPTEPAVIEEKTASLIRLGDRMAAAGDAGAALSFYQQAHIKQQNSALPLTKQAAIFLQNNDTKNAGKALQTATEIDPGNSDAAITYAQFLIAHNLSEAPIFLQKARDRFQSARFENWLGVSLDLNGQHDSAQEAYKRGLEIEPNHTSLMNNLGLSFAVTQQKQQAYRILQSVLERDPDNILYHKNLAIARIINGDIEDAHLTLRSIMPEEDIAVLINAYNSALANQTPLAVLKKINNF